MKTLLVPVAALLVAATAALAQPDAGSNSSTEKTTAEKTDEKGERLVCRWVNDADVGSLIQGRTRRCLTAEQWRTLPRRR